MDNALFRGGIGTFGGMRIVEDPFMTDTVEDWSCCRSIPRAKRRHARGIKTAMRYIQVPKKESYYIKASNTLVIHPEMKKLLVEESKKDKEQRDSEAFLRKEKPQAKTDSPWHRETSWTFPQTLLSPIINTETS